MPSHSDSDAADGASAPARPQSAPSAPTQHPPLVRTATSATQQSTTTTLNHPPYREEAHDSCPPPIPAPDVVAFVDPAAVGGGGPLLRIATAHSERELRRERSRSGNSVRPSILPFTKISPSSSKPETQTVEDKYPQVFEDDVEAASKGEPEQTKEAPCSCPDVPHIYPDGGYGWVVVACCCTLSALTNGWGMSYGVFQQYYTEHTFPNAESSVVSLAGTTQGFGLSMMAIVSGRLGDRYGFKRLLALGAFVCWIGTFSASFSKSLWSTILCQGVINGIGQGIMAPLFMSLPSQWFYKHRGLASGITMGGAGLGGGISSLIIRRLLSQVGPHKTLLIMSFVNLFTMGIAIILLRVRPTSPEAAQNRGPLFNKSVFKASTFWSIALSLLVGVLGYGAPFMFLGQWVSQRFPGASPMMVTAPITILSFCVCIGRSGMGWAADYVGAVNTYILILVFSGVVQFALWLTASSYASICAFAVMYGLIAPGYLGLLPQIVVTLLGPASLASNTGLLLLFNAPGTLVSGPLGGALYDMTGHTSFKYAIIVLGSLQTAGGLIACWARFKTDPRLLTRI